MSRTKFTAIAFGAYNVLCAFFPKLATIFPQETVNAVLMSAGAWFMRDAIKE